MSAEVADPQQVTDQSHELISSTRVEGTPVYNTAGEKLGTVHSVMIHKRTGQVAYAIMSFGGFLRLDQRVHPIPWQMLDYDENRRGYVVDLTRDALNKAPTLHLDHADRPTEVDEEVLYSYYSAFPLG